MLKSALNVSLLGIQSVGDGIRRKTRSDARVMLYGADWHESRHRVMSWPGCDAGYLSCGAGFGGRRMADAPVSGR